MRPKFKIENFILGQNKILVFCKMHISTISNLLKNDFKLKFEDVWCEFVLVIMIILLFVNMSF